MEKRVSKNERLEAIIVRLCEGKKTVFAEMLGKSQQNMSALLSKGVWYDACALAEAFPELNEHWLLTGEGEMLKEAPKETKPLNLQITPLGSDKYAVAIV